MVVECKEIDGNEAYSSSGILFNGGYVFITANVIISATVGLDDLIQKLSPGRLHPNTFAELDKLRFQVISKNTDEFNNEYPSFNVSSAEIIAVFNSEIVYESTKQILSTWTVDSQENSDVYKRFSSLFFVLSVRCNLNKEQMFEELLGNMHNMWKTVSTEKIRVGQKVLIRSSPFGNKNFIDSHSQGIISNILGRKSCFLFSDCPTVIGSEGSPMFAIYR